MGYDDAEPDGALEIEVGPLNRPAPPASPAASDDTTAPARPLLTPMRTRREHLRRGVVVTAGLLVVLVALVLSITPTRAALFGSVHGPAPTATERISAGEDSLYITLDPNWGAVSLDNQSLTHLPAEGVDQPLRLSRGRHTIHWRFAPMLDYVCHLTVPSAPTDNCLSRTGIQPGKKGIASVVMLQLSLLMLEPAYRHSLIVAIQAGFDAQQSSDIVRPGEAYRSDDPGDGSTPGFAVVTAHQPLRATLRFVSDAENHSLTCPAMDTGPGEDCMMVGNCLELCVAPWQNPIAASGSAYQAYIVAHPTWRYTTLDGHVVADNAPDYDVQQQGNLWYEIFDERPTPISITWDGANWHVSASIGGESQGALPNPVCATTQDDIASGYLSPPSSGGWQATTMTYIPSIPGAAGCLLVVGVTAQEPLLLLHRFGVLLAASDSAAYSFGHVLPMADAYEQALARKLAQQNPSLGIAP